VSDNKTVRSNPDDQTQKCKKVKELRVERFGAQAKMITASKRSGLAQMCLLRSALGSVQG